jgi:hypothetical protein
MKKPMKMDKAAKGKKDGKKMPPWMNKDKTKKKGK